MASCGASSASPPRDCGKIKVMAQGVGRVRRLNGVSPRRCVTLRQGSGEAVAVGRWRIRQDHQSGRERLPRRGGRFSKRAETFLAPVAPVGFGETIVGVLQWFAECRTSPGAEKFPATRYLPQASGWHRPKSKLRFRAEPLAALESAGSNDSTEDVSLCRPTRTGAGLAL